MASGDDTQPLAADATVPLDEAARRAAMPHASWERYAVLAFVGEGGMGRVYKGWDPRLQRPVALKFLGSGGRTGLARFFREAQLQARIEHPSICKVYEVGEVGKEPFIAMQYIDGKTLAALHDGLSLREKVGVMEDVARAVDAAHQLGLIHRDLKPSNIMVERAADGSPKPYVMDFGLAREVSASGLTATGDVLGTPAYMAPEQASGRGEQDPRTDVYGLGATLFSLLTGRPPFLGSAAEVLSQVLHEDAPSLRHFSQGTSADLETIVSRCLDKDPARRYPTAGTLADDLRRYLDGEPIQARRASVAYRLRKKARKHRAAVVVAAAALLAGALAFGMWLRDRGRAEQRARLAQRFGQEVERLRSLMRRAYSLPLHDVRGDKTAVATSLGDIEREMRSLGDMAEGAGQFALGSGWLSLKDHGRAREHLEAAWRSGYREPEVAYALGLALGGLYRERLVAVDRVADGAERERRRAEIQRELRDPAVRALRQGAAAGEDPGYADALIAFFEGRPDDALARAHEVEARAAWLYEARILEGEVHTARSRAAYRAGDAPGTQAAADQALAAYRAAADLARSDATVYAGECASLGWLMTMDLRTGHPIDARRDAALAACDQAIAVDADLPQAYYEKMRVRYMAGQQLAQTGGDPTESLDDAVRLAGEALRRDPSYADAYAGLGNVQRVRGRFVMAKGGDPGPALRSAIAAFRDGLSIDPRSFALHNDLGVAHAMLGAWEAYHGTDPRPNMDAAVAAWAEATKIDPADSTAPFNIASLRADKAVYEMGHGIDPRASFAEAIAGFEQATAIKSDFVFFDNLAGAHVELARWAAATGGDPTAELDKAEGAYRQGLAVNPQAAQIHNNRAKAELIRAEHALGSEAALSSVARAEAAVRQAMAIDKNPVEYRWVLASVEILGARAALALGRSPAERFAAAEAALAGVPPEDPEGARVRAELHRRRAEWRLATADIDAGLAAVAKTEPGAETAALRGALELLDAQARNDASRAATAAEDLAKAIAANRPMLERAYGPLREEAARRARR
jgi:eukaryotic-like serine/threonine-protein kinase